MYLSRCQAKSVDYFFEFLMQSVGFFASNTNEKSKILVQKINKVLNLINEL